MLYDILSRFIPAAGILLIAVAVCLIATYLCLKFPPSFLPKDQGRAFAVNGQLSKGKTRGVGLIMVIVFLIASLSLLPLSMEYTIYCGLLFLMMVSGYLDDASKNPWSDYKKGAIDLIISVLAVANFLMQNDSAVYLFGSRFVLHPILYAILGIVLIWVSVNATSRTTCTRRSAERSTKEQVRSSKTRVASTVSRMTIGRPPR